MFERMLVPLDDSPRAERAIPVAARLALVSEGTVVLLRVVSLATEVVPYPAMDPGTTQAIINADLEEAKHYVERMAGLSSLKDVHTETEVIVGQPAATILGVAETQHSDLIVLCSHGYTDMKRWVQVHLSPS